MKTLPLEEVRSLDLVAESIARLVARGLSLGNEDLARLLSEAGGPVTPTALAELKYWASLFDCVREAPTERNALLVSERLRLRGVSADMASRAAAAALDTRRNSTPLSVEQTWPRYPLPTRQIHTDTNRFGVLHHLAFSPRGTFLLALTSRNMACVWDISSPEQSLEPNIVSDAVHAACFASDDSTLFISEPGSLRCFDIEEACDYWQEAKPKTESGLLAIDPWGFLVATADDSLVSVWDCYDPSQTPLKHEDSPVNGLQFGPKGELLVWGCEDGSIAVWDVAQRREVRRIEGQECGYFNGVEVSSTGRHCLSGKGDIAVELWDLETGESIASDFSGSGHHNMDATFSSDGTLYAISCDRCDSVAIRETATGTLLHWLTTGIGSAGVMAFQPYSQNHVLAVLAANATVRVWNAATGQEMSRLEGHARPISAMAFSRDGHVLATADSGGDICFWPAE